MIVAKCQIVFLLLLLSGTITQFADSSTQISNVNFHLELFTPKSLVRFFDFNDSGIILEDLCIRDLYLYLDGKMMFFLCVSSRNLIECLSKLLSSSAGLQRNFKWAYKCECEDKQTYIF